MDLSWLTSIFRLRELDLSRAIGDVSATERSQYMPANRQAGHAVKNIILSLSGKPLVAYKAWPRKTQHSVQLADFTNVFVDSMGLQIGKKPGPATLGAGKFHPS